jgi:hypothetical protein
MTVRTSDRTVVFKHPFQLTAVGRVLPAGAYRVMTDEELIEGLSFPVYRRVSTVIFVPSNRLSSTEMVQIDPSDLQAAQDNDDAVQRSASGKQILADR